MYPEHLIVIIVAVELLLNQEDVIIMLIQVIIGIKFVKHTSQMDGIHAHVIQTLYVRQDL